jgi:hypothetical protein
MGFKNVMKKIGKIALTAAPYVAAPFTGGLSLAATGLANKAVAKWSEHDAKDAISKGLAPSNFDKVLGKVGNYASMASSFLPTGALGSVGKLSSAVGGASKAAKIATTVGKGASNVLGGSYNGTPSSAVGNDLPSQGGIGGNIGRNTDWGNLAQSVGGQIAGDVMARRSNSQSGSTGIGPSSASVGTAQPRSNNSFQGGARYQQSMDLNNPNLANSIAAGRKAATKDQGFRRGYDVVTHVGEPDEAGTYEERITRMPRISSDFGRPGAPIGGSRYSKRTKQAS